VPTRRSSDSWGCWPTSPGGAAVDRELKRRYLRQTVSALTSLNPLDLLDLARAPIVNKRHAIARPKFLALCRGDADTKRQAGNSPGFE
jgi:hypothetical protein